jgi:hypothetical protein
LLSRFFGARHLILRPRRAYSNLLRNFDERQLSISNNAPFSAIHRLLIVT